MPETKSPDFLPYFAVIASIFGAVTLAVLLSQSGNYQSNIIFTRTLIGAFYIAICLLGIFAVFYPKKCQGTFTFQRSIKYSGNPTAYPKTLKFRGHHPTCSRFSGNRIKIRKTIFCAACGGLFAGATVAFVGSILYFFLGYNFFSSDPWIFTVGNIGMLFGLFQYKFAGYVKLAVNALFVICSFVMLNTVDLVGKSLIVDLYALGLIVLFLYIRILLSERNNERKCRECKQCF